jgi:spoIIIJ-associated protein
VSAAEPLSVEATGETVGEAKWLALRDLERLAPGLDKGAVRFQVVSEGERGLLGVGFAPARVVATVDREAVAAGPPIDESPAAARTRALLERITVSLGLPCRVVVREDEESLVATVEGDELGLLIGRHGQTIDSIQYLANAIVWRGAEDRKRLVVDAAGYRARREETLEREAVRAAERVVETGQPAELEPMSAIERKVVHERLKDYPGVATSSDGAEPHRYVVISPA